MLAHFKTTVEEYIKLHNSYCKMKINEEKAKVKKVKISEEQLD